MNLSGILAGLLILAQLAGANPSLPPVDTYNGEGTTIAILDRGFSLDHESFTLTDPDVRITKELSDFLLGCTSIAGDELAPESVYVSPKIPFAYDYGDGDTDLSQPSHDYHGTAMISIAAGNQEGIGNKNIRAESVAPEAQVLAMKVYSDAVGDVTKDAMCAAIEDSLILGADVILIAVTSMCGFEENEAVEKINDAIEKAEAAGVIVVCAAGEALSYGTHSVFDVEQGLADATCDNPDIGTVAWPGSLRNTLCVTSSANNIIDNDFFTLPNGIEVPYADSNFIYPVPTGASTFTAYFDGITLEYVITEGVGTPEELATAGDLTGKLAVITRGELSFAEKAENAAKLGAVGIILIDTEIDPCATLTLKMDLKDAPIPVIIIPRSSGHYLRTAEDKKITVNMGNTVSTVVRDMPILSSNTAWGTTPELGLKPDIAAVGNNILCASTDGGYTYMSSTTAAAANAAGMCLIVKSRLADIYPDISDAELMKATKTVLVNSSDILLKSYDSLPYSPRAQGGGTANLDAALNCNLLLTSDGSYKIELGDGHSRILTFSVTAHNLSGAYRYCKLDAIIGSNGFEEYTYEMLDSEETEIPLSKRLGHSPADTLSFPTSFKDFKNASVTFENSGNELNRAADNFEPYRTRIAPHSSETFEVTVTLDEETYNTYIEQFKNGFFIEGFMRLSSGREEVSIPLLAFSGDFSSAPSFEPSIYEGKQPIYDSQYLYLHEPNTVALGHYSMLGRIVHDTYTEYDKDLIAFSPTVYGVGSGVMLNLPLLRSILDVTVTVTDETGEIISTVEYGNLPRTYANPYTDTLVSPQLYLWDGRATENPAYIYPDGVYTITVSYRTIGAESKDEFSYELNLDTTAPKLISAEFVSDSNTEILYVDVQENHCIDTVFVCDNHGNEAIMRDNGVWDVSTLTGKYIYIDLADMAMNSSVVRIENPNYASLDNS